jgi:hypothetical protein
MKDYSKIKLFKKSDGTDISYDDVMRDIYENNIETKTNILDVVQTLITFMKTADDAVVLMQHLTELLNSRIKNDDLLLKMLAIIGRHVQKEQEVDPNINNVGGISEEERTQLLAEVGQLMERGSEKSRKGST